MKKFLSLLVKGGVIAGIALVAVAAARKIPPIRKLVFGT